MTVDDGPVSGAARSGVPGSSAGRHRAEYGPSPLREFNTADVTAVTDLLGACLDIPEWVVEVAAGRPYPTLSSLRAAAAAAAAGISWEQVSGALDRHPRIGEAKATVSGTRTESAWSVAEQAGVEVGQAAAMAAGNRDYDQRFGHIFLICAAGLSGEQILDDLRCRLSNDAETEKDVVTGELRKIAALRLAKAVTA